jgi:thiol peroxidase
MAQERTGVVTFKGNGMTLVGPELKVGDKAPDFTLTGAGFKEIKLSDTAGSVRLISVVPSLDTPVCEQQTRKFNERAVEIPGVKVLTVSLDLPTAQGRFCSTADIENLECGSDYRGAEFGKNYGLLIKELHLLTRAVLVVGKDDKIKHLQIVNEVAEHPDYDAAIEAAKAAAAE